MQPTQGYSLPKRIRDRASSQVNLHKQRSDLHALHGRSARGSFCPAPAMDCIHYLDSMMYV